MRFRFSIRDLLWLTALVAMAVAWWIDHWGTKYRVVENGRDLQIIDNKAGALWEFKDAKLEDVHSHITAER